MVHIDKALWNQRLTILHADIHALAGLGAVSMNSISS